MRPAPLVTVGMPVRNGGAMFERALDSVLVQTHANLEIVISDNGSTDGTAERAERAAAADPRVRVVRQDPPLTAYGNFMHVLGAARGEFFLWAAHDDLRSPDYVERLLPAFEDPAVVLAFGDLYLTEAFGSKGVRRDYDFASVGLTRAQRLRKQALMQCYHIYGLFRTSALQAAPKVHAPWWADLPVLMSMAAQGSFAYRPGAEFVYLEVPKTDAERTAYQDGVRDRGKIANVAALLAATYRSLSPLSGSAVAALGVAFVAEKNLRFAAIGSRRRLAKVLRPRPPLTSGGADSRGGPR